jgi:hypothetical protein
VLKYFLSFTFLLSALQIATAQSKLTYRGGAMVGFLAPHHPEMAYLVNGHSKGLQADLAWKTDGSKDWHHAFNFPTWGLTFNAYDLSSPYLGSAASARLFIDLPLNPKKSLSFKMSIGGGYVEKPFDLDDNYLNTSIGSFVNSALSVELLTRIGLSEKLSLKPGLGIHHFSNAAIQLPNSGLNLVMVKLAMEYDPGTFQTPVREKRALAKKYNAIYVGASAGAKRILPIGGKLYLAGNVFGIWQRRVSQKSSIGAELGLSYNSSLQDRDTDSGVSNDPADNYRPYLLASYQLHFEPFGLRFQGGSYLFPKFKDDGLIFLRYHLLYNLSQYQVFVGLKSHFAKADHFEVGMAYKLTK